MPIVPESTPDPRLAFHEELLGSMQVFARVVGPPAAMTLSCTDKPPKRRPTPLTGRIAPAAAFATVMLEYTHGEDRETRFVTTDASGVFRDAAMRNREGPWRVQAGGNAPVRCPRAPARRRKGGGIIE